MNRIAIVGTSNLTHSEEEQVKNIISKIIKEYDTSSVFTVVITGDADGVDKVVRDNAKGKYDLIVVEAKDKRWEAMNGYKDRNTNIANLCTTLYCITTHTKTTKCYHCNEDHQRTGGCWTMKYAKSLGKPTKLLIV